MNMVNIAEVKLIRRTVVDPNSTRDLRDES